MRYTLHDGVRGDGRIFPSVISVMLLVILALSAGACSRLKAQKPPDNPPLDMPAPPPRDVETTETEPPPPVPLISEPAHSAPARPRPAPPREQPRPEPAKPEPPKPEAAPEPPKPAPEEPSRPPTLQTTPTGVEGDLERGIRATLSKANGDLSRVDYRTLNADARTQYDYAKSFIRQAEDAIRGKNLVYARTVADKAAAIAAQLTGR